MNHSRLKSLDVQAPEGRDIRALGNLLQHLSIEFLEASKNVLELALSTFRTIHDSANRNQITRTNTTHPANLPPISLKLSAIHVRLPWATKQRITS